VGCATLCSDRFYPVAFDSDPKAEFTITNREGRCVYRGYTPVTVTLDAKAGYGKGEKYHIAFQDYDGFLSSTVSFWVLGDIWWDLGLISLLAIDFPSGNIWNLDTYFYADLRGK